MERKAWTDERLDDMAERGQDQFELLVRELQETRVETRTEMRELRRDLREEMHEMRRELRAEIGGLNGEMHAVRRDMFRGSIALFGVLLATYATTLVHLLS